MEYLGIGRATSRSEITIVDVPAENELPYEFDLRYAGRGFIMRGWDFTRAELAAAVKEHRMLNPALELGTNACPWNCSFCFTEDPANAAGRKRRLENEMGLSERLALIEGVASLGARSINFVGAGEPTIDPHFWTLLERMKEHDITPIVYTEASLRLTNQSWVRRLYELGATVVVKVNSFFNDEYQNAVVQGGEGRAPFGPKGYAQKRTEAIKILI